MGFITMKTDKYGVLAAYVAGVSIAYLLGYMNGGHDGMKIGEDHSFDTCKEMLNDSSIILDKSTDINEYSTNLCNRMNKKLRKEHPIKYFLFK